MLIYLSGAWLSGILLGDKFHLLLTATFISLGLVLLLFLLRRHRKTLVLAILGLLTLLTGAAHAHSSLYTIDEGTLRYYNNRPAGEIRGMVASDPDVKENSTHLTLQATTVKTAGGWREVDGRARLFVPRYPEYRYGDILQVSGQPRTPGRLDNFDYQGYLAHRGIHTVLVYPEITVLERGKGFPLLDWIYAARGDVSQTLSRVLPEPQAALAQGMVLGIRGNIPSSTRDAFARTGTAHLLAISGLHLGIIAGSALAAGSRIFGRRHHLHIWLALAVIWLYALVTGLHPPVVRGAIMATVFLAAEISGRQRNAFVALLLAAAVMVGISPYILGDASFQLSFLAMSGLVFLYHPFRNTGRRIVQASLGDEGKLVPLANLTVNGFSATLAAIAAVWPVIAHYFGIFSLVGPLATFLTLPALPGIITTGIISGILGHIALPVAQVFGWLNWLFLSYVLWLVNGLAASPLSSFSVESISPLFLWSYYLLLVAAICFGRKRKSLPAPEITAALKSRLSSTLVFSARHRKWVVSLLLPAAALIALAATTMPDGIVQVSFLNIGQGDAILVQKGQQQILVDGGPNPLAISRETSRKMPFWDRSIDLVVLTHPDSDHLAGLVEVMRRYRVKHVLYPGIDLESPLYEEFQKLIREKNITSTTARSGQVIEMGEEVKLEVLNPLSPPLTGTGGDPDNNSIVLRLETGNVHFLLTGDIRREAEFRLITSGTDLRSEVLKIAHHGSETSSSPEFLAVVQPQAAVISVGAGNKYGLPDEEVLHRLSQNPGLESVYRTDRHGTIDFITDGERLWVKTAGELD